MKRAVGILLALAFGGGVAAAKESREEKVRGDKARVEADGFWIYDDLAKGFAEARATGKPLVVALRCIPCEDCVALDDDLVDRDTRLRPLLEKFVRVRVVSTNGLDLSLFQFDTDQSFAVFLLRADGTVYGRFGTRSAHREWADDVSIEGLARALEGALALHAGPPEARAALAAKRGPVPPFPVPERLPALAGKYRDRLDYEGKVVPSCIHCHQIGEAVRSFHREKGGRIPEDVLFPFPHPKSVGLVLDPKRVATVLRVEPASPAERSGFRAGDEIRTLAGQPLLSIADVQWVLDRTPASGGDVEAALLRDGSEARATLRLADGWRRNDDVSWRASTWPLRRIALGGMKLDPLPADDPARPQVPKEGLALRVGHVGQYAPHDVAKRAGFRVGDVVLSYDGRGDFRRETDVLAHGVNGVAPGTSVEIHVLRGTEILPIRLPVAR